MNLLGKISNLFSSNQENEGDEKGFGTLMGVFIPNITFMFGVIIFLRLGVVVGTVGPWWMAAILFLSAVIMILTSLSITAIVTNMKVGTGGVYYIISRSVGIEIGGAIGFALYAAQICSISLCVSGFAYSLQDFMGNINIFLVEVITIALLALLTLVSTSSALKTQLLIFVILILAVISILFGSSENLPEATLPAFYIGGLGFWAAFSIIYPAMTGIEAGMAMSGNLKNPSRSLPIGNITSLLFAGATYLILAIFLYRNIPTDILASDPFAVIDFARWRSLILLGIWGATLSSALGCLLGAPRMLQSFAEDGIIPEIFSQTFGKHGEPRYSILLTFLLSLILLMSTTIDQIIPILAMICLISYGTLNSVALFAEIINSPSWRPAVRVHWLVSFLGALLCLFVMFMIDSGWAFTAIILVIAIYLVISRKQVPVSFQDFRESLIFFVSRLALYRLSDSITHAIHWHPQLLVFTSAPVQQEKMIRLVHSLTKRSGILTYSAVLTAPHFEDEYQINTLKNSLDEYFRKIGLTCLTVVQSYPTIQEGIINQIKSFGIGPIAPNTIVLGLSQFESETVNYVEILDTAKIDKKNVLIFSSGGKEISDNIFAKRLRKMRKEIDIWWDGSYRNNFELMLSYTTTLTDGIIWGNTDVTLKSVVSDEGAKENLETYFRDYLTESRLKFGLEIYVEPGSQDFLPYISKHSYDSHLTFVGLPQSETEEETSRHIAQIKEQLETMGPVALVACFDNIDHKEIYDKR